MPFFGFSLLEIGSHKKQPILSISVLISVLYVGLWDGGPTMLSAGVDVCVAIVEIIAISVGEMFYLFNWNPACEQATDGPQ